LDGKIRRDRRRVERDKKFKEKIVLDFVRQLADWILDLREAL
jgi:hypothetical protein